MPTPPRKIDQPEDTYIKISLNPKHIESTERIFAGLCIYDYASFRMVENVCSWNPVASMVENGFVTRRYNKLFHVCMTLWSLIDETERAVMQLRPEDVLNLVNQWAEDASIMGNSTLLPEEAESLRNELETVWTQERYTKEYTQRQRSNKLMRAWVRQRAADAVGRKANLKAQESGMIDIDDLSKMIVDSTPRLINDDEFPTVDSLIQERRTVSLNLGFSPLQEALGSYLHMGDSTLIGAAKGGGKTVLACQLVALACKLNYPTIMFTTEEDPVRLFPRMISNMLGIPIGAVRHTEPPHKNQSGQLIEEVKAGGISKACFEQHTEHITQLIREVIRPNLQMIDWSKSSKPGTEHFETAYQAAADRLRKQPLLVIFDWLGGALNAASGLDYRLQFNELFNAITKSAGRNGFHAVVFCQLMTQSIGRIPNMQDISESKSLPDHAANYIGISSLLDKDTDKATALKHSMYSEHQYLVCNKSRFGEPSMAPIRREFQFQRFAKPNTSNRPTLATPSEAAAASTRQPNLRGGPR
jgi:hypothetical protein